MPEEIRMVFVDALDTAERARLKPEFLKLEREFSQETKVQPLGVLPTQTVLVFRENEMVGYSVFDIHHNDTLVINRMYLRPGMRNRLSENVLAGRVARSIIQRSQPPPAKGDALDRWLLSQTRIRMVHWFKAKRQTPVIMTIEDFLRLLPAEPKREIPVRPIKNPQFEKTIEEPRIGPRKFPLTSPRRHPPRRPGR